MVSAPSSVLDTPYPQEAIPGLVNEVLGAGDWLSPSHVLLKGIELVFGFNPGEEAARWVAGDWEAVSTVASALDQGRRQPVPPRVDPGRRSDRRSGVRPQAGE